MYSCSAFPSGVLLKSQMKFTILEQEPLGGVCASNYINTKGML